MELSCASTAFEVRGVLLKNGETIADWARKKGYNPTNVARYLARWSGKNKRPRGQQTLEIIEELESETGVKICGQNKLEGGKHHDGKPSNGNRKSPLEHRARTQATQQSQEDKGRIESS